MFIEYVLICERNVHRKIPGLYLISGRENHCFLLTVADRHMERRRDNFDYRVAFSLIE